MLTFMNGPKVNLASLSKTWLYAGKSGVSYTTYNFKNERSNV